MLTKDTEYINTMYEIIEATCDTLNKKLGYLLSLGFEIVPFTIMEKSFSETIIEEFKEISKAMHMEDNVILNVPELQDDITKKWDAKIVSDKIDDFLKNSEK